MIHISLILSKYRYYIVTILLLVVHITSVAQTPGMIIKPISGGGVTVLDPDGDGYVSQKTNGIQLGFTIPPNNDVFQSEIPYVALVRPDIQGDLERGPTGGFTEIVGTDEIGNNAILTYTDGVNLYYRFRLSGYAPNSKSYSILIDTNGKFGFTGDNRDLNAVTGNPGFEVEIVLETNFNVYAYNVDGSAARPTSYYSMASYDTNCQKSIAVSTAGGDPDYFYDFFIPFASLPFTNNTALRYVALTSMNPMPAIGNNAVSDVGGVGDIGSLDQAFIDLITAQTPTFPGQEVLERTACPSINSVGVGDPTISGTTVSGATVNVFVYQNNGTTLLGSGTIPTPTTGTSWSIAVSSIKNTSNQVVPLVAGYKVKATAIAPGYAVSLDNCDVETVLSGPCTTTAPSSITFTNSDKDLKVNFLSPVTGTVTVYNSNGTVWKTQTISNALTTTLSGGNPVENGSKIPNGNYSATLLPDGGCESTKTYGCLNTTVQSGPLTINPFTLGAAITGIGAVAGSRIVIYANNIEITSFNQASSGSWSTNVSNLTSCQNITAIQIEGGKCISTISNTVQITKTAAPPSILPPGCFISPGTIYGTSTEIGAIVTLYRTSSPTGASIGSMGTATVQPNGTWSVGNLTLGHGDILDAAVTSGTCLTESVKSSSVTISTPPNISAYPITFNTVTEGGNSLSGTISGVTSAITLKLFVDGTNVGSTTITSNGNWNVTDINPIELYAGGKVKATVTIGSGCESALSSSFTIIQCLAPEMPVYTGGSKSYCLGGTGQVSLTTSQSGVIYQLVNASGVAQGPAALGTGDAITLFTNALNADLLNVYVKAFKIGPNACAITTSTAINFDTESLSPSVTFTTSLSVARGTTTSLSLPYSNKSTNPSADTYTIDYSLAANNQKFLDVTTPISMPNGTSGSITLAIPNIAATASEPQYPAIGTYSGTITIYGSTSGTCHKSYSFTITVFQSGSAPVISTHPGNQTICSGTAAAALTVTASGTATLAYQWQSSTSFSFSTPTIVGTNSASYSPGTLASTTYYRVIVSNGSGSVTSNVATISAIPAVGGIGTIAGTSTVCAGLNSVNYSVSGITNATTYTWNYTGTGALINGTGASVFINFSNSATSGILTVTGTGTNNCGSVTSSNYSITVNPLPIVSAGVGITTCSNSGAVNITSGASASNYTTLAWTSSGSPGTIVNALPLSTATYTPSPADIAAGSVTLTLTATNSCGSTISTKTLTITNAPVATAGSDITTCSGTSPIAMTGASANGTYTGTPVWSGGTGTWVQNANPSQATFTPNTASGSFTATLTLNGCSSITSTRTISWNTASVATFTSAPGADICLNESVTYTTEPFKTDYEWTIPGTPGDDYYIIPEWVGSENHTVTIKWLTVGNKTVSVKYKDSSGGCTGTAAIISTEVHSLPPIGDFY